VNDIAINVLAYGRKRWFIEPPGHGNYTAKPVLAWLHEDYHLLKGGIKECVQEAGDIMYLPSHWAHQTLNLETSIGIAHEFMDIGTSGKPNVEWNGPLILPDYYHKY